jgi:catechol 2,3-dioxygenase-like lactoylglutathione lyase family enzyme
MSSNPTSNPRLSAGQVCFVVDDVAAAADECASRFGWGPFHQFSAPVPMAHYHGWSGPKNTDVALGMAGAIQVELIHVHEGHDTVEAYQSKYGVGFQHLGIHCRDRDEALDALESLGARCDDRLEYPGVRIAFVDTPTGPGMFELLQSDGSTPAPGEASKARKQPAPAVSVDRATIATRDLDAAIAFYAPAFGWEEAQVETHTLRFGSSESRARRARGRAGRLLLELIEPTPGAADPYADHLARREHGLVHAGGVARESIQIDGPWLACEWLEEADAFELVSWSGGPRQLQLRSGDPAHA